MRSSPLPSLHMTMRVFAKAIALLLALNLVCIAAQIDPIAALTRFNTWWIVGHGRARLVYPSDFQNGQLPIESLMGAHTLAYTTKANDEFRVLVLGESGIAGWGLPDQDTFSAQLTARNLKVHGKRLVAYNLAYPSPNVARDILILDAALSYQPDLIIWFITPAALDNAPSSIGTNSVFFDLNRDRLQRLTTTYALQAWFAARMDSVPTWRSWTAIRGQDTLPVWLNTLLYPFIAPDLGQTNRHLNNEPIPAKARYTSGQVGFDPMPNETWRFLDMGKSMAQQVNAQLLLVNEPMLIGSGSNSDVNYNLQYERAFYEAYRQNLTAYAAEKSISFVDLWNVIPAASFTDTPLHANAAGYAALVDQITIPISKLGEIGH
ncbi:MAG: SGNH/GDSL hydrolase family protein [Chloroflexota bacterium]